MTCERMSHQTRPTVLSGRLNPNEAATASAGTTVTTKLTGLAASKPQSSLGLRLGSTTAYQIVNLSKTIRPVLRVTVRGVPAAGQVFAPSSFWYQQVPADAPVNANSAAYAGRLVRDATWAAAGGVAVVNTVGYAPPIYIVDGGTPRQKVYNSECNGPNSDPEWMNQNWSRQFDSVPIPSGATPAPGEDKEIVFWSPSTNELWELWQFEWTGSRFQACWGGKIDNTKTNNGAFPNPFGVTASGLSLLGGSITVADVQSGSINHAMTIGINAPYTSSSWPATRSDGTDSSTAAIPEGLRLRLDPSLNLNTLNLTPFGKMIAKAAQQYGFIVRDNTAGPLVVDAESSVPYTKAGQADPTTVATGHRRRRTGCKTSRGTRCRPCRRTTASPDPQVTPGLATQGRAGVAAVKWCCCPLARSRTDQGPDEHPLLSCGLVMSSAWSPTRSGAYRSGRVAAEQCPVRVQPRPRLAARPPGPLDHDGPRAVVGGPAPTQWAGSIFGLVDGLGLGAATGSQGVAGVQQQYDSELST